MGLKSIASTAKDLKKKMWPFIFLSFLETSFNSVMVHIRLAFVFLLMGRISLFKILLNFYIIFRV